MVRVAVKVPRPWPPYQGPTLPRMPLTAKAWLVQLAPLLMTYTVPPVILPVASVGMPPTVVATEKLPTVVVAWGASPAPTISSNLEPCARFTRRITQKGA